MQQTAVQRALQPPDRPSPKDTEYFDMTAGDEAQALGAGLDEKGKSFKIYDEMMANKRAKLASILAEKALTNKDKTDEMINLRKQADELEEPSYTRLKEQEIKQAQLASILEEQALKNKDKTDETIALGSAAASSSGYAAAGSSTAIVPVGATTQGPEAPPRYFLRGGHRRTDSSTSTISAVSAKSATSTASTVAIPKQMRTHIDIDVLIGLATERRREWNLSDDIDNLELSMEISELMYKIEKLKTKHIAFKKELRVESRTGRKVKKSKAQEDKDTDEAIDVSKAYVVAKKRLMNIMEMPE